MSELGADSFFLSAFFAVKESRKLKEQPQKLFLIFLIKEL